MQMPSLSDPTVSRVLNVVSAVALIGAAAYFSFSIFEARDVAIDTPAVAVSTKTTTVTTTRKTEKSEPLPAPPVSR